MHLRRLVALLALGALATVPEALVRADDAQIAFQTWLVVQLLGVIVAAIAVAAMFSVLGLGIVRLLTRPLMHRASTFVAWSFLRAPRVVLPLPARLWHALKTAVDAPVGPLPPPEPAPWRKAAWLLPFGLALVGAGAVALLRFGQPGMALAWPQVLLRNAGLALALHGLLLACAALPWRRARPVPIALLLLAVAVAVAVLGRHPVLLPHFDPAWAIGALLLVLVLAAWRAGIGPGLAHRLQGLGRVLLVLGVLAVGAGFALRGAALGVPLVSTGAVLAASGLYLVLQGQAKVSLPVFVSIVGVAAGTWALIVVLSVMGGFARDLREKMLVANAHALVERAGRALPLRDVARLGAALRQVPGVAAVSPQVRGDAVVSSAFNVNNFVAVRGVDPALPELRRELGATLVQGSLALLAHPGSLGSDRAQVRKPAHEPSDLPPAPALPEAATPGAADAELDALLRLAPGPANAPVPQGSPTRLASGDRAAPRDPLLLPTPDADLGTLPIGPGFGPAPPPLEPSLGRLGLDAPSLPGESVDVPVAPGILLGVELARSLQVELGDRVEVVVPDGDVGPTGLRPRVRTFRVAGTFETGLYEADSKVAYISLVEAAGYFNLEGDANVLELRLDRPEEPDAVLAAVRARLRELQAPADVEVVDWRELNRSLFSALAFERLVIFLVLGLIILVAAFSIVSALTMVILQKYDSIAMLRAMGSTAGAIRDSFVQMGGVIGLIGTTAGGLLGVGTCMLVQHLGIQLPEAYYVRTLPVHVDPVEIVAVVVAAVAVSLVATIFPATSAARCKPLEGLRHG